MSLSTSWIRRLVPCLRISYTPSRSCCVQNSSIIRSTSFRLYELYFLIQATVRIVLVIEASWRQRLSFSHFVFHFHSPPPAACAAATIGHGADITEPSHTVVTTATRPRTCRNLQCSDSAFPFANMASDEVDVTHAGPRRSAGK